MFIVVSFCSKPFYIFCIVVDPNMIVQVYGRIRLSLIMFLAKGHFLCNDLLNPLNSFCKVISCSTLQNLIVEATNIKLKLLLLFTIVFNSFSDLSKLGRALRIEIERVQTAA